MSRTGISDLREVTESSLRNWFYEGKERYQWSASNYRNYWLYLKQFFDWCVQRAYLGENPILAIEKPRRPRRLPRRISQEDAQKLLYTSFNLPWKYRLEQVRNHAMIATSLNTGIRAGELLKLEMTDVDLAHHEIVVRNGKGGKDRVLYINPRLSRILRAYIEELRHQRLNNRHFFCSIHGNQLTYMNFRNMLRRVGTEAKVKVTSHQLRHTFASACIENGYNPYELQQIMGHSSFQTTEIYLSLTPAKAKQNFMRLDLF